MVEYGWGARSIDVATWQASERKEGPSMWGHDRVWLSKEDNAKARALRLKNAADGFRRPVQVMDGNYEVMSGVCPWWDSVKVTNRRAIINKFRGEHGRPCRRQQRPHAQDRRIRLGSDLRADSGRGARADKASHSRFARLRHLWRQPRMVPHPARARSKRSMRRARPRSGAPTGSCLRRMRRWSTARRCRASSSTTCTARPCCMSARSRCRR